MTPNRRPYQLSPDQPILRRKRRRKLFVSAPARPETDFWKHLDVDKLCSFPLSMKRRRAEA